jgi:hypothetical protein
MCQTERVAFNYLYEQIRSDYITQVAWKTDNTTALQLGCIEIRRFFKDIPSTNVDRKVNIDFIENEIGYDKFFPESIILNTKVLF